MESIPSNIFQFDQTDELFHMPCFPCTTQLQQQHDHEIQEDQIPPTPSQSGRDVNPTHNPKFSPRRIRPSTAAGFDENAHDHQNPSSNANDKKKKVVHREIERQRRQEMTTLYVSIRSLLPREYLRGNRSTSDHINEAANYIKDLNKRIQELSDRRDELKGLKTSSTSSSSSPSTAQQQHFRSQDSDTIAVRSSRAGMEVVINTSLRQGLPLSRALKAVVDQGLTISSCVSSKVNARLLHSIDIETSEGMNMDPLELEQKLKNLLN